ncbi:hypothetical protein P153DRAFT_397482, partial [Dothidotthia symphoricarpi CBS 119687]
MNSMEMTTLTHLNKPQKRALILRDQLRFVDPHHLDSFLDGISNPEPPNYVKIYNKIQPALVEVTLKESATRYDLGNVVFPDEGNAIYRAHLTVENDRFEMRTEDPLPKDEADLDSVPIHCFIAKSIIPLFKGKVEAIFARRNRINEARRVAYNMPSVPAAQFQEGETLARLEPQKTNQIGEWSQSKQPKKRKPGDPITKHTSNKRRRIGLDTIPDNVKSEMFNTIPDQLKVEFFNTMVKTAFPNFDNLMMASWNVVSVYSNVGSEFPELHKAIVDLKAVLDEFETACATKGAGSTLKMRTDFVTAQHNDVKYSPKPGSTRQTIEPTPSTRPSPLFQPQTSVDPPAQRSEDGVEDALPEHMPPPRVLQFPQHNHNHPQQQEEAHDSDEGAASEDEQHHPLNARLTAKPERKHTALHLQPTSRPPSSASSSTHSSPHRQQQTQQLPRARVKNPRTEAPSPHAHDQHPNDITPELSRKRLEYHSSISRTNRNSTGAAKARLASASAEELDGRASGSGSVLAAPFLGNSVLGARKAGGKAPVAPMLHVGKEGNVEGEDEDEDEGEDEGRRGY